VSDWATIAEVGTAAGTLVLAFATFAAVRSANRAARAAERGMLAQLRPLLLPSRLQDPLQQVGFQDDHWVELQGGHASAEITDEVVYLAIALRNVGSGLAVLDRWAFHPERVVGVAERPDVSTFRQLVRDLYIPAGDAGFWQAAFRDRADPAFTDAAKMIVDRQPFTIDIEYGDYEGGQRMITRFTMLPARDDSWLAAVTHHWNIDRSEPR
jgi:hypothetical protein